MSGLKRILILIFGFHALFFIIQAQEYRVSNYGTSEGILHPFVYTINQDSQGYIWIGTGEGICRFNGFSFVVSGTPDTLKGQVASVSLKDSRGNVWFGFQNGSIAVYNGKSFNLINTGKLINSAITGIVELSDGNILISTLNNGISGFDGKQVYTTEGIESGNISAVYVKGNILLTGTHDGLKIYSVDNEGKSATKVISVSELEFSRISDIQPADEKNSYWIAAEEKGVFKIELHGENYNLTEVAPDLGLGEARVQSVFQDDDNQLWIGSYKGVYRLSDEDQGRYARVERFSSGNGLSGDRVRKVFRDLEGNIWIALYGDGLSMLTGQPMVFSEYEIPGIENNVLCVAVTPDGTEYVGGSGGLFRYNDEKDKSPRRISGIPATKITALLLKGNTLYAGTESNGLYVVNTLKDQVKKVEYEAYSMGKWVSAIALSSKYLYLGTKDGVYRFNLNLQVTGHFTTTNGMPHNYIEHLIVDSRDRVLIATKASGIITITDDDEVVNVYPTGTEVDFKSVTEDESENIWAATYGDGVLCFTKDSLYQFTERLGLKSNYCYGITADRNGHIWVGHRMGLSRINLKNMLISLYDQHLGVFGDVNLNAVYGNEHGDVYFGTTEGLIGYHHARENKTPLPPFTNIVSLLISDKPFDYSKDIVLPYKIYNLRIEFIGLNYSDPNAVRYQYKLEGYDLDWSDITSQTSVTYPRIEDGEYTFYVRSYNNEGLTEEIIPVTFHLRVKPPLWKRWWFIAAMTLAMLSLFYLVIKYRERKQKQLQEYLERELTLRTKEVVEQKEEIEIKNRDITDSINYAKRIQTSMLPPVKRLQQHFSGCFVFYSPRDIVSGDFYWFDRINENKFIIVCADSTGHGVPGAFMSMIGSTLIKDICNRESDTSPSKVLQVLDCELRNTLNHDLDDGTKPGDGMDIIVCEIDLKTHYIRFASAMRPMIIYKDGEEIFIKGSRNSVGGHYDKENNLFEDEGLQLSKGDIIYMFSDGYSDQFGGPMGKKFKMIRLKNLLQDIHSKPMDEQCLHVKNTFNLWKENYDQVDDVLFMGIKI